MDIRELANLVRATADDDPMVGLSALAQLRSELERVETVLVRRARNTGATWPRIAAILGFSKQTVQKKYGGERLLGGGF